MIPRAHITAWRDTVPWVTDAQVEQDLVISRALVDLYSDDLLARELTFRGGTALHKLHLDPPVRYSEDIDLVQVNAGLCLPNIRTPTWIDSWRITFTRRVHRQNPLVNGLPISRSSHPRESSRRSPVR